MHNLDKLLGNIIGGELVLVIILHKFYLHVIWLRSTRGGPTIQSFLLGRWRNLGGIHQLNGDNTNTEKH